MTLPKEGMTIYVSVFLLLITSYVYADDRSHTAALASCCSESVSVFSQTPPRTDLYTFGPNIERLMPLLSRLCVFWVGGTWHVLA